MSKQLLFPFFLAIAICSSCNTLIAQLYEAPGETHNNIHLRKRKKTVTIFPNDYIGLTTATDTVKYFGDKIHSYKVFKADTNGFLLRRPVIYKDTIVESGKLSLLEGREHLYGKGFRTGKKWYASIVLVDSYEYKSVPFKNITTIQYPPDAGNTMGCMSCAIIPVYNIFYFIKMRKRWHPKNFEIGKWRLEKSR